MWGRLLYWRQCVKPWHRVLEAAGCSVFIGSDHEESYILPVAVGFNGVWTAGAVIFAEEGLSIRACLCCWSLI